MVKVNTDSVYAVHMKVVIGIIIKDDHGRIMASERRLTNANFTLVVEVITMREGNKLSRKGKG